MDDYTSIGSSDFGNAYASQFVGASPLSPTRKVQRRGFQKYGYELSKRVRIVRAEQPASAPATELKPAKLRKIFLTLAETIEAKHGPAGFFRDVHTSDEYLQIVGLGPAVLPLLLKDLEETGRPWYVALRAVARADVGREVAPGDLHALRSAWLNWGQKRGLL